MDKGINIFKRHYCKASEQSIIWAVENHQERNFIFFLKLKRHYKTGAILAPETKYKKLNTGESKSTYLRRIEALKKLGWANTTNTGIQLISLNDLPVSKVKEFPHFIYIWNDKDFTIVYLRNLISAISERGQLCKIKRSTSQPEKIPALIQSAAGALVKNLHDLKKDVSMSVNTLALKLNRCKRTAQRQLRKARELGIIKTYSRYVLNPLAEKTFIIFEKLKYSRIPNIFETVIKKNSLVRKDVVCINKLSLDERINFMYCNDMIG